MDGTYFDELYQFIRLIKKRKLAEYKMQLLIAQNPHSKDPKELWESLEDPEEQHRIPDEIFDKKAILGLKNRMSRGQAFQVK